LVIIFPSIVPLPELPPFFLFDPFPRDVERYVIGTSGGILCCKASNDFTLFYNTPCFPRSSPPDGACLVTNSDS